MEAAASVTGLLLDNGFQPVGLVKTVNGGRPVLKVTHSSADRGWVWCLVVSERKSAREFVGYLGKTDGGLRDRLEQVSRSLGWKSELGEKLSKAKRRGDQVQIWARKGGLAHSLGKVVRLAHQEKRHWNLLLRPEWNKGDN
jgi:hypothetical protein